MEGLASGSFRAAAGNAQGTLLQAPAVLLASRLTGEVRMLILISKPVCFCVPCQPSVTIGGCHTSVGSMK